MQHIQFIILNSVTAPASTPIKRRAADRSADYHAIVQ
jgi:hypothetical protein